VTPPGTSPPAALPADLSPPARPHLVATWNIHKGVGGDRQRDLARTAAVIGQIAPDIMALQEADTRFGTRRGLLDLQALARDHGLCAVPGPGTAPAHGWHGNVVLLRQAETQVEAVHRIALPGLEPRGALIVDLALAGRPLRVIGAHLGLLPASRSAQTRHLVEILSRMDDRPALLMGDLNQWRRGHSAEMRHLGGHFVTFVALPSYPARFPVAALDRIMATSPAGLSHGAVHDTALARRASDHLPVTAQLHFG
jgi:endonuclease/exonuclease/phosphatase family metal-dependent hydrolase